jgi:uncharacterized protein DUF4255/carboxypeptidase family protein
MLNEINKAFESLLRERGLIDPLDVDVRFDVPSDEWIESLTRPTVNAFLFELHENTDKRDGAPVTTITATRGERRMAPRRIDLVYMVSVLTADIEDENELLWRVLATLMKYQQFPPEVLPASLRTVTPPLLTRIAAKDEARNTVDIWSALGTEPRPTICYIITAPMDLALAIQAPLVLTRTARYRRMGAGADQPAHDVGIQIGGFVKNGAGDPVPDVLVSTNGAELGSMTKPDGHFVLRGVPEGLVRLTVRKNGQEQKTVEVRVPAPSYDIVLDG